MRWGLFVIACCSSMVARDHWVTIFLHGGGAHPLYLNVSDTFRIIHDDVERSIYERTTALIRKDPYFMQVQPQQGLGLKHANGDITFDPKNGAHLFGLMYETINKKVDLPETDIYTFGWSGLLSIKARRAAAKELYHEIARLVEHIRRMGDTPHVRLLAYSHGGNVGLHLVEEFRANGTTRAFTIDEFILVATPVHQNTLQYLSSPLFKKVYLFYSIGDNIQNSDFLSSPTHSFAHRIFQENKDIKIPDHITQVQIRIWRKSITVIQKDGSRRVFRRHDMIQPNHTEMFFFGWAPEWYRKHFPIKPLSVGLLVPYFLRTIYDNKLEGQNLRFTLVPAEERMIIYEKMTHETMTVPFFDQKTFLGLRQQLWDYKPDNMDEYHDRMKAHWKTAKKAVREQVKQKQAQFHKKRAQAKLNRSRLNRPQLNCPRPKNHMFN